MTKRNQKPHLTGEAAALFSKLTRKELQLAAELPSCQAAKVLGCTCSIITNGGGTGGVKLREESKGKYCFSIVGKGTDACPLHAHLVAHK